MTIPFLFASIPPPTPSSMVQLSLSPEAALERLFTAPLSADWFAPSFLEQVPLAQVEQIISDLQAALGAYSGIQPQTNRYQVQFQQGTVPTHIALDANGQIVGLFFETPQRSAVSWEEVTQELREFPGQVNLLVLENSTELAAFNADQPLAVGSTFKLAVLVALRQQIEAGQRAWSDVVVLQPEWKSLPSGFLHTWFDGALLTLQTLASLMISQSDNTATDALIHLVRREAVEAQLPLASPHNRPFLTTREAFILKAPENRAVLERYRAADANQRRHILAELASLPLPSEQSFSPESVLALDVEWFFTPRELCQLMAQVADLPLMGIQPPPGLADPQFWSHVAYKGGSEPGVLNLTTWLAAPSGKTYCVSSTWNDTVPLNEMRLLSLYSSVLASLQP